MSIAIVLTAFFERDMCFQIIHFLDMQQVAFLGRDELKSMFPSCLAPVHLKRFGKPRLCWEQY